MKIIWREIGLVIGCAALLAFASLSSYKSASINYIIGDPETPIDPPHYNVAASKAVKQSRRSAVRVMSISPDGEYVSSASGTYIKFKNGHYVLTVSHGLVGECEGTKIVVGVSFYDCVQFAVVDYYTDYAIIEVEQMPDRKPVMVPGSIPRDRMWGKHTSLMRKVFYTGYPNGMGPLTFDGSIVGFDSDRYVYIHSFAWSGSSGSGVFNDSGKLIGYILAINVGVSEYGLDVLEDVVIVVPLLNINWNQIKRQGEE